ncbi:hypothetical protein [Microscilla marina]|uniref:Uncharacterized protein n=1 Tax=Microscilla marina ATCC 23134 TaxID=313606 RepID=A1ZYF5_MICM2|nr:hypothetical protein [Microscilla marina]EAY24539.1 hypothetical protein M23134_06942 [Microscilla marina ATCC 23134]
MHKKTQADDNQAQDQTQAPQPVQKKTKAPEKKTGQSQGTTHGIPTVGGDLPPIESKHLPHRSNYKNHKAKQTPYQSRPQLPHTSDYTRRMTEEQRKEPTLPVGLTGDITLYKWVFLETDTTRGGKKLPFKLSGEVAIMIPKRTTQPIPTGTTLDKYVKASRSGGGTTIKEVHSPKGQKTLGKYSSKLFDLNTQEAVMGGIKLKLSAGFMEFKTSMKDAKKLKTNPQSNLANGVNPHTARVGKGVMGMGFDFDPFNISLKVTGRLHKNSPQNEIFGFISHLPLVKQALASGITIDIVGALKISPTIGFMEYGKVKAQKEALKKLETSKRQQIGLEAQASTHPEKQRKLKKLGKQRHQLNRAIKKDPKLHQLMEDLKAQQKKIDQLNQDHQLARQSRKDLANTPRKKWKEVPKKKFGQAVRQDVNLTSIDRTIEQNKLKQLNAQMRAEENKLAKKLGLDADIPSQKQLIAQQKALSKKAKNQAKELKRLKAATKQHLADVEKIAGEYSTKYGKKMGARAVQFARVVAHLNLAMDTIDGLALLLAFLIKPDRATHIFNSKNTISATDMLLLLAQDLPEGDQENSAHGTTDWRKAATSDQNKAGKGKAAARTRQEATGDTVVGKGKTSPTKPHDKHGNGNREEIMKVVFSNLQAKALWQTLLAEAILRGTHDAFFADFTLQHAQALVRIAQKYGDELDISKTAREYSQAAQKTTKGTMDDYLAKLEGACARTLDPTIKKGKEDDPKVDRENQHVVHDKGLEKEKGKLEGVAKETRSIPVGVVSAKPDGGRYVIDVIENAYKVGSTLTLNFVGTTKVKSILGI